MLRNVHRSADGQAKVEYVILISIVALVVLAALVIVGPSLGRSYGNVVGELGGETSTPVPTAIPTPTPEPTPEEEERLFYGDFSSGDAFEWYEVRGRRWRIEDGAYRAGPGGEHRSFTGDESWTDYVIELDAHLYRGKGFGIYFRATDPDRVDGYCFQYDPGYGRGAFLFRKVVNGREQRRPLVVQWAPRDYDWYSGPRHIRLEVVGNTYTAYVDGVKVAELVDDSFTHGGIGLRTWGPSEASFDNIVVRSASR